MGSTIHFLRVGDEAGPAPAPYALFGVDLSVDAHRRPFGWEEKLDFDGRATAGLRSPLTMWVIRTGTLNIVVDTGCTPGPAEADAALARNSIWVRHEPEWTVEAQLATVGLTPADVDVVINTCCHFDHIGSNTYFPKATFFIQRSEYSLGIKPPEWAPYYYPEFAHNLLDIRDRLELPDGDFTVADGVTVHHVGGHSPGAQVVVVGTDQGRVCLPGDLVPFYKNLELNWPSGIFFNVQDVMAAYRWMSANSDLVIPHHDWQVLQRYPDGVIS
jgi:glyoxylase-like metal-dependent hydrolase (beta-lactamase superfamily II)